MSKPLVCVAVASVLALSLPPSALAGPPAQTVEQAKTALRQGQAAYDRGDFAAAMESFERAYELDPQPVYLYPWAQAARNAGDCTLSRELYQRFLDSGVQGDARKAAEQNMTRCEPEPEPAPVPEPEPEATLPPDDDPTAPTDVTTHPPDERRKPDALGVVLLSTGAVAAAAGVAVLGISGARIAEQSDATDHDRFDELDRSIDRLQIAGGITLGVGAALLLGGAIRLGRVRRTRGRAVAVTWSQTVHGTPVAGIRLQPGR